MKHAHRGKLDLEKIRASLNTPCPHCSHSIKPEEERTSIRSIWNARSAGSDLSRVSLHNRPLSPDRRKRQSSPLALAHMSFIYCFGATSLRLSKNMLRLGLRLAP